jgi:hypothetical protein
MHFRRCHRWAEYFDACISALDGMPIIFTSLLLMMAGEDAFDFAEITASSRTATSPHRASLLSHGHWSSPGGRVASRIPFCIAHLKSPLATLLPGR